MEFIIHYIVGLILGFILELFYRSFNAKRIIWPLFINLQMYGLSTEFLYFLSLHNLPIYFLILFILIFTTGIEFIIGYTYLKYKNIMLWDYWQERFNYKGLICIKFSILWVVLCLVYYFLIMNLVI
jgi:uncharacterized membrane protein